MCDCSIFLLFSTNYHGQREDGPHQLYGERSGLRALRSGSCRRWPLTPEPPRVGPPGASSSTRWSMATDTDFKCSALDLVRLTFFLLTPVSAERSVAPFPCQTLGVLCHRPADVLDLKERLQNKFKYDVARPPSHLCGTVRHLFIHCHQKAKTSCSIIVSFCCLAVVCARLVFKEVSSSATFGRIAEPPLLQVMSTIAALTHPYFGWGPVATWTVIEHSTASVAPCCAGQPCRTYSGADRRRHPRSFNCKDVGSRTPWTKPEFCLHRHSAKRMRDCAATRGVRAK